MKNKDYIKENKIEDLFTAIGELGYCSLCDITGCRKYCKDNPGIDCKETIKRWMEKEHVDDLFPRGTIVEFLEDELKPNTRLGYYNGYAGLGMHRICVYKESVGNNDLGQVYNVKDFKQVK